MTDSAIPAHTKGGIVISVIKALLIDLMAFTLILPLFPRLLNYYRQEEAGNKETLLGYALQIMEQYKYFISGDEAKKHGDKWDTVFLGGLIGSLFSFLQFFVSPIIGRASDRYGRRKVLLYTMIGNLVSTGIWIFARSFTMFLLARVVAGLSEGNVQLSIAIISDITPPDQRSRSLALVGIAFAIAFTFGPGIGAWFASIDLSKIFPSITGIYPFSMPAIIALILLTWETFYIYKKIPETNPPRSSTSNGEQEKMNHHFKTPENNVESIEKRISNLRRLKLIHGLHLFLFSGMEFTLVFLTFDVLDYSNMQQGKLLGYMGILSALLQGIYVRRQVRRLGEKMLVLQGMVACVFGLSSLAMMAVAKSHTVFWLYLGVSCLALTTGTVVNCLTGMASLQCQNEPEEADGDEKKEENIQHPMLEKGRALGEFRSSGQLGRALGPVSACGLYWLAGPAKCYGSAACLMSIITIITLLSVPSTRKVVKTE